MPAVPPETQTANYGWIMPYPSGSTGTWGATLNADLIAIDSQVKANANAATIGVIDGSSAAAGAIGEVISANVTVGINLTTSTGANVASITLTAGDWDVSGEVWFNTSAGMTGIYAGVSPTSTTFVAASSVGASHASISATLTPGAPNVLPLRSARINLTATTVYYLVAAASFASGTVTATGNIWARRAR